MPKPDDRVYWHGKPLRRPRNDNARDWIDASLLAAIVVLATIVGALSVAALATH